jgi:hypothetical protein
VHEIWSNDNIPQIISPKDRSNEKDQVSSSSKQQMNARNKIAAQISAFFKERLGNRKEANNDPGEV